MDFYTKDEYTIEDIKKLIDNEVEENIHLDYKAAGALAKEERKRIEITKDVSAFANSDGGLIIYGLREENHKPKEISLIDGNIFTKEWLEHTIQLIQPRIENVMIYPVRDGDLSKSIYVVKIPRSDLAPHMAHDRRYYKKFNFESAPMYDYEVKELYNRASTPKLRILECEFYVHDETKDYIEFELCAKVENYGHKPCELYKLNFYINRPYCTIYPRQIGKDISYTRFSPYRLKISTPFQEAIFPNEVLDIGCFKIRVAKEDEDRFFDKLVIDMILYYPGGRHRMAYDFSKKRYIEDEDEIVALLDNSNKELNNIREEDFI